MGSTQIQFNMGPLLMERLAKYRSKVKFDPVKSDDQFVRTIFVEQMDKVIPE